MAVGGAAGGSERGFDNYTPSEAVLFIKPWLRPASRSAHSPQLVVFSDAQYATKRLHIPTACIRLTCNQEVAC